MPSQCSDCPNKYCVACVNQLSLLNLNKSSLESHWHLSHLVITKYSSRVIFKFYYPSNNCCFVPSSIGRTNRGAQLTPVEHQGCLSVGKKHLVGQHQRWTITFPAVASIFLKEVWFNETNILVLLCTLI